MTSSLDVSARVVLLAAIVTAGLVVAMILGICVWLIAASLAPPSLLLAPIGSLVSSAGAAGAAYLRGLYRMPPSPPGTEYVLRTSLRPPPFAATEQTEIIPRPSRVPDVPSTE